MSLIAWKVTKNVLTDEIKTQMALVFGNVTNFY